MKMHFLSGGRLRMRRSVYFPDAPREETIELPVSCTLLKHPQGNVLFDTGCSPQAATDPEGRWGSLARAMAPIFTPEDTVVGQLPKAGLTADDIDVVLCSHLHVDHCGCNEHFKRATIFCHAAEVAAAKSETGVAQGYFPLEWDQPQGFEEFDGQRDVFGDGKVILLPVPGHTVGMTAALVGLDKSGEFLLASDAVPMKEHLDTGFAPKNSWDKDKAVTALEEIRRIGERGATIIFGHDEPQWLSLKTGAAFYE
jgi:glyoxylase-like metal-dependent hydrolase (beta-lactamase superfamily II)